MAHYLLKFKTVMPLIIGENRATQNLESLHYIPGGTLLGGIVAAYSREKGLAAGERDEVFETWFLNERARFGNLYPANFDYLKDDKKPVKPLPHTSQSCKRWSGFAYKAEEDKKITGEERHGVTDHLILWTLFAKSQKIDILKRNQNCFCEQQLDHFSGFYRMDSLKACETAGIKPRLVTGTGINRATGTVQSEILYNYTVIPEDHVFQGTLHIDDDIKDEVSGLIDLLNSKTLNLRVGRSKTRGLGRLQRTETVAPLPDIGSLQTFRERLEQFDALVKEQAKKYDCKDEVEENFFFAVTCCSDLIVRENDLRYRTRLTGKYLQHITGLQGICLVYHNASTIKTRGWNMLWRLPKAVEIAIEKGSVFMFEYAGPLNDEFFTQLYQLERNGLGCRKPEGFGWISVSDDFHREVTPV